MKKSIYIFCFVLGVIINCNSQNQHSKNKDLKNSTKEVVLYGNWDIDNLIEQDDKWEYYLYKGNENRFGNYLVLNTDNTFVSGYAAWCGNDCFTKTFGKYKLIGNNHISFFLEKIEKSGDCGAKDSSPNQDKGLFFIYKDSTGIKLIKSDGKIKNDLRKVKYSALIDSINRNNHIPNLHYLKWQKTNKTEIKEITFEFISRNPALKLDNATVLYSKRIRQMFTIILLENNKKYYYLVYDHFYKNSAPYEEDKDYHGYADTRLFEPGDPNYIYTSQSVEVKPNYPGGMDRMYDFLKKNYVVPTELKEGASSKIYATFIVEKNGSLNYIQIRRDPGYGSGKELVRVLKLLDKWNPAEKDGKKVRSSYNFAFSVPQSKL